MAFTRTTAEWPSSDGATLKSNFEQPEVVAAAVAAGWLGASVQLPATDASVSGVDAAPPEDVPVEPEEETVVVDDLDGPTGLGQPMKEMVQATAATTSTAVRGRV